MKQARFTDQALIQWLPDKRRLKMRHGPIDLVIEAVGEPNEVRQAYQQAAKRFLTVLEELTDELGLLRRSLVEKNLYSPTPKPLRQPTGQIASHMQQTAYQFYNGQFMTPMICVAGAVADHMLATLVSGRKLDKAYVNNGGDIALYLAEGQRFDVGVCSNPLTGSMTSKTHIVSSSGVGGIATSGWRGRSHSLGIADAVTVLARDAAAADTAATLIANAIDLPGHPAITREKANELMPDSDLVARLVTTDVGELTDEEIQRALSNGKKLAQALIDKGDVIAVYASLQSSEFSVHADDFYANELYTHWSTDHLLKPIKEMIHA